MKIKLLNSIAVPLLFLIGSCTPKPGSDQVLSKKILSNEDFSFVKQKAMQVMEAGFNAGGVYIEVWIRDFNTFMELACDVHPNKLITDNLLVFFRLQQEDGGIVDGFTSREVAKNETRGYDYIFSDLEPDYCGHKNTVETDQETSLVQAVYKYIQSTGDLDFLNKSVGGKTIGERLEMSMEFLLNKKWSDQYGMIIGATTADWGDVQHTHPWGVFITKDTHFAVDIYDNAMFLIALDNLMEILPRTTDKWKPIRDKVAANTMITLWDEQNQKFIPHVYLTGSPYSEDFNENEIFYHGGTAVAIEAGLLNKNQIKVSLNKMIDNVKKSGAASIGLTLYPPYPDWAFENKSMSPYGYQNGGDWTWFGARMIQQMVRYGFVEEAYQQLQPMTERVVQNDGFYEWYTVNNQPEGSGTFKGSAGVLFTAINLLENWATEKIEN